MMSPIGAYCDFCQTAHFGAKCLHPGRKLLEAAEAERDEWRTKAAAEQRKVWQLEQNCQHWQERALAAEARLDNQAQHPGFPQPPAGNDPDEPVAGTA